MFERAMLQGPLVTGPCNPFVGRLFLRGQRSEAGARKQIGNGFGGLAVTIHHYPDGARLGADASTGVGGWNSAERHHHVLSVKKGRRYTGDLQASLAESCLLSLLMMECGAPLGRASYTISA